MVQSKRIRKTGGTSGTRPPSFDTLTEAVDRSLKRWRLSSFGYEAFQPLVDLQLRSVEAECQVLLEEEFARCGLHRIPTDRDRQFAAYHVLKRAIDLLRPFPPRISPEAAAALDALPAQKWPPTLPIPWDARVFLLIGYAFLWGGKTNEQIGRLLSYSERNIAYLRKEAAREIAGKISGWEG